MAKKALKLLVSLLFLSYVVYAAAVPATRISMTKKVDALLLEDQTKENVVMDIKNQKELFDTKEEHEEGRMIMDITDYPPTGPNHSHTPKSPGKPGN
ncbi:hypothetical protein PHAVU_004G054100 [Phaseolus vulgaris]|uniref:Uncharacterized protein n=1 Tax=Phaseolus vulgaris TaxID=3885 RepID=V7C3N2_PHAVU|nr:hypothetical protein PHAVU_004G054100g [Phaseolus vulgaris]ESW23516.1 hypothetical protein PHAVU_004G054100g [Phaseolus vulgaris]